jgi:hypothetical protein
MQSATFKFVEDYIEYIGGFREATGRSLVYFEAVPSPISLARYDVKIIQSLAIQTSEQNRAYTDKQAELAVKLIQKYERQLTNLKIFLPDALDDFRYGIRQVDRTKSLAIKEDKLILKFPYDTKLLPLVKQMSRDSDGYAKFDYDSKYWILGLTEPNLNWSMALAQSNHFMIDPAVQNLYNLLLDVEKTEYKIELVQSDDLLKITNAADSLVEYIEQSLGGFSFSNLLKLVDYSSVLGYSVSESLLKIIKDNHKLFYPLLVNRQSSLSQTDWSLDLIEQYAELTDRLPIYVYDTKVNLKETDKIKLLNKSAASDIAPKLLVSTTPMMIGPKKQSWLANSEKIIILT